MVQMKERNKTPGKKNKLNEVEITNLSDKQFKTLVIRMPKELIEYGNDIKEEMMITISGINEIYSETSVEERKLGLKLTIWNIRKK